MVVVLVFICIFTPLNIISSEHTSNSHTNDVTTIHRLEQPQPNSTEPITDQNFYRNFTDPETNRNFTDPKTTYTNPPPHTNSQNNNGIIAILWWLVSWQE